MHNYSNSMYNKIMFFLQSAGHALLYNCEKIKFQKTNTNTFTFEMKK